MAGPGGHDAAPWPYLTRHSYPCIALRVRFGVVTQPTASHETPWSKEADENCPTCSASHKMAEQAEAELMS